ncbi:Deoxycytidine kinase 1 [Mucor circinelloides]
MKWLPLPKIAHGIAIYPFSPSSIATTHSTSTSTRPSSGLLSIHQQDDSSIHTASTSSMDLSASTQPEDYSHLIPLEVGDELFIIEQQGQWYRGYVLCPLEQGVRPNKAPIGCFPRSHVQIKEYLDIDPDEADTIVYRKRRETSSASSRPLSELNALPRSFSESYIHNTVDPPSSARPGSFGDLNFEYETSDVNKKSVVHIPPPPLPLARYDQSTVTGSSEPLVDEIAACVSEWNSLLYTFISQRQYNTFNTVRDHINYLFQARRQLLDQALSREELAKLRKEIINRMVTSNMELKQDMIIRHPEKGYLLDPTNASLSTIYRMHFKYATASITNTPANKLVDSTLLDHSASTSTVNTVTSSATNTSIATVSAAAAAAAAASTAAQQAKGAKFYHLFFELKACVAHICQPGEFTELYFSLFNAMDSKFLTEQFVVVLNYNGMPKDESQIGKLQALFVDLSLHDLTDDLYMVCHVVRLGGMKLGDSKDHFGSLGTHTSQFFHSNKHLHQSFQKPSAAAVANTMCRRPFGCAVLKLSSLALLHNSDEKATIEHDMPVYAAISEANYTTLHEDIIFNNTKEFQKNPRAESLRVSLRTFYGFLDEVLKTNAALLQDIPQALRLGFADVAFPDDSRNDLYIKLESGDLTQFGRSRNIQVTMCVRDNRTGEVIENAISVGAGARPVSYWESMVMYHEQRPKWGELIKINMEDLHQWERSHVFLTVKHRSSNFTGAGSNTPILKFGSNNGYQTQQQQHHQHAGGADSPTSVVSATSGGGEKIIAMGFLPLFLPPLHRDFVADGSHTLHLYKYDRQASMPRHYLDNMPWCLRSTAPSNMAHQSMDVKSPRPSYRTKGHAHSPSTQSFKSLNGSFNSSATAFNTTSASNSVTDVTTLASSALQQQQQPSNSKLVLLRDTITLNTFLCSNKFTQNKTLVKLLNWRALMEGAEDGTVELLSVLDQFTFVGEVEVVKFLGDIFDALLDILTYEDDDISELVTKEIHDQVLAAIVWLLGIVQDRRFSNFRPVLDVYIQNRFSIQDYEQQSHQLFTNNASGNKRETRNYSYRIAPETTFEHLMKSLSRLCRDPSDASKAKLLRSSMKVWDYLFRFIVRSRLNQQQKEHEEERAVHDEAFKNELDKLLLEITSIMSPEHPSSMIGTQTLALQHFADILVELHRIFSPQQVVQAAVQFVDACAHVTGRLVGFKLAMILSIIKGPTFEYPSCRLDMAKNVIRWIRLWLNSYMATAKDVIFARQVEQQQQHSDSNNPQQTRLPRSQWIENLRLSTTILSELLDRVRKSFGMTSSGLTSSCISSPSISNYSRPTSFAATHDEDAFAQECSATDLSQITEHALQLIPQLLNAYKDIQRLTVQAMHVSSAPPGTPIIDTHLTSGGSASNPGSRPHSRQSFSILRERASSIGANTSKNPLLSPDILQEMQGNLHQKSASIGNGGTATIAASGPNSAISNTNIGSSNNNNNSSSSKSKFTVVLQALSTSPATPFPSTYPFQPAATAKASNASSGQGLTSDQAAMISTGLLDLTVVILELFYMTPKQQWVTFIKKMQAQDGIEDTADFLRKIVYTCMGILFGDNILTLEESSLTVDSMARCEQDETRDKRRIPQKWLNFDTIAHQIILCNILEPIKSIFELPAFIPTEKAYMPLEEEEQEEDDDDDILTTMDEEGTLADTPQEQKSSSNNSISNVAQQRSTLLLWRVFYVGFLRVVGSPRLEISDSMPQVQRAVWKITGNMRGEVGAKLSLSLWKLAGKSASCTAAGFSTLSEYDVVTANKPLTDYFGSDFSHQSPVSSTSDFNHFNEDSLRQSMASIEEVDDDEHEFNTNGPFSRTSSTVSNNNSTSNNYSVRNSVRIGPTDELPPLSSIHEEHFTDTVAKSEVSFLQADLAYFILSPMCAVSLTLHDRVRVNALAIIADIIAIELYSYGELLHVQHVIISTLDRLVMSENKGNEIINARITVELNAALEQRLLADNRQDCLAVGTRAVESLCKFHGLLLQIRSLPSDDDEFMDERITATLKLMKFIQVIEREEIYIKYVHQLVQLHLDSRNFIEAALTLRFHADLLQWDPSDKLAAISDLSLPVQSSFSRKEGLYMKMITYLDQGNAWEICVQLCKELAYEYENTLYDYIKLSDILQRQATFAENIVKKERCFTEYFRVGFYGRGFPASNRNRQYIYRGLEWEKMSSFVERMQNRHPNAQLLPSKISNSMSISDDQLKELDSALDGQYLQITPVTPIPDTDDIPCLSNPNAPDSIKKYYSFNNVSKFSFSKPVTRESTDKSSDQDKQPESDFLNLWTEKFDFECEDKFPTIVRRSKIISSQTRVISPIENAVTAMENKNKELESLEKKYAAHLPKSGRRMSSLAPSVNINPFSMSLNGAVDAPVNGGVPLYKKAFLSKEYWDKNPEMRQWIYRLQNAIQDQVLIIKKCLETHNKLVSNEMRPFHTTLTEFFNKNFAEEIKSLKAKSIKEEIKEAPSLSISTNNSLNRRRSTLSSSTTAENNSVYSHQQQVDDIKLTSPSLSRQNTTTQTPGVGGVPVLPTLPVMSPISRAFSIRTPVTESSPGLSASALTNNTAFENATMSRAESLSRTLKMSLRKKSRKKSQNTGGSSAHHASSSNMLD